jgi:glycylpeptide N-tetradecanoyltransferase
MGLLVPLRIGDGNLQYYLYNWRIAEQLEPGNIGLVLT